MPRKHVIETTLSDRHFDAFNELLNDRRTTVNSALAWLQTRGYSIGRASVGRYMRSRAVHAGRGIAKSVARMSASDARERLAEIGRVLMGA